ncbi:MAG: NUDIX hydrolase [Clostridia bacterium]
MSRVKNVRKQTENRFLNIYELEAVRRSGKTAPYFVASRAEKTEDLKAVSHHSRPDGVIIYGVYGEKRDKIVLVRQFRYPIDGYIYEFPAGLAESGEDIITAGVREMFEETGLALEPIKADNAYTKPFYTTVGMTDECCATVYGYCSGTPTSAHQEDSEDIEVVLADREECKRILREENVAIMCAYMLMHFIHSSGDDPLSFLEEIK